MLANQKQLVLVFVNINNQEIKLKIRSPSQVDATTINQVMDKILSLGAYCGSANNVSLKNKKTAYISTKEVKTVNLK